MTLSWKQPCNTQFTITGLGDETTVYIIYAGRRTNTTQDTCSKNSKTCSDIYFAQSYDEGHSWTEPVAVPKKDMNDNTNREDPKIVVTSARRVWIFYKLTTQNSAYAYCTKPPDSSIFSLETVLPITVPSLVSVVAHKHVLSVYFYNTTAHSPYQYYTENNGIEWKGPLPVNYCGEDTMYAFPFNSASTETFIFVICRDGEYIDYLKAYEKGFWERVEMPKHTYMGKHTVAGNGGDKGFVGYGFTTVYYLRVGENSFRTIIKPPVPKHKSCVAVTSTYQYTKFWFWYETSNENKTAALWATSIEMTEELAEQ
eukprot:TRINITY_DN12179_c0_g1_i1.p2 TRINITY_DN12179_c0_g1~~TRINITY_DN12179_c0_g1_i1.p2  ORF type:complete len:312 (+),score=44.36 TRINITY_DN12179_c0_g1_i1:196-1131(+)